MKKQYFLFLSIIISLASCVGTDEIDDSDSILPPTVEAKLIIDPVSAGLMVNGVAQFNVTYSIITDGEEEEQISPVVTWTSDDASIAEVSQSGEVTAIALGSTKIRAQVDTLLKEAVITVVGDTNETAQVIINESVSSIKLGETFQLTGNVLNVNKNEIKGQTIAWESSNDLIASIDQNGLVTANAVGATEITATADGVSSGVLSIDIKQSEKTATFSGNASYDVSGKATMFVDENEDLILEFSSDFAVSSFGSAIYVYLSNSDNSVAGGAEIQQLTTQGAQSFNLTEVDASLTLDSYDYIIIHCKPFNIPFGQSSKLQ